jgi:hypothetical protein
MPTTTEIMKFLEVARDTGESWASVDADTMEADEPLSALAPPRSSRDALDTISEFGELGTGTYGQNRIREMPRQVREFAAYICLLARDEEWAEIIRRERAKGGGKRRHSHAAPSPHRKGKSARSSGLSSVVASINRLTK